MVERYALIMAGGVGRRAGGEKAKQFVEIGGVPMILRTMNAFYDYDSEIKLVVVMHPDMIGDYQEMLKEYDCRIPHMLVGGGGQRAESVSNGLSHILKSREDWKPSHEVMVAVHDAARPMIDSLLLERAFAPLKPGVGRIPVTPSVNSLRRLTSEPGTPLMNCDSESVDRSHFLQVQTPQMFLLRDLASAYAFSLQGEREKNINFEKFTDDASLAEAMGLKIELYEGSEDNIKVTHPIDFIIAEAILKSRN